MSKSNKKFRKFNYFVLSIPPTQYLRTFLKNTDLSVDKKHKIENFLISQLRPTVKEKNKIVLSADSDNLEDNPHNVIGTESERFKKEAAKYGQQTRTVELFVRMTSDHKRVHPFKIQLDTYYDGKPKHEMKDLVDVGDLFK